MDDPAVGAQEIPAKVVENVEQVASEEVVEPGAKRQRVEEGAKDAELVEAAAEEPIAFVEDIGAAKEAVEDADTAEDAVEEGMFDGEEGELAGEEGARPPVTVGYKTFTSGRQCYDYFHSIISGYRRDQNLNDVSTGRPFCIYSCFTGFINACRPCVLVSTP